MADGDTTTGTIDVNLGTRGLRAISPNPARGARVVHSPTTGPRQHRCALLDLVSARGWGTLTGDRATHRT